MPKKLSNHDAKQKAIESAKKVNLNFIDFNGGVYAGAKGKIRLLCNHHGEVMISLDKLSSGTGCKRCANARLSKLKTTGIETITSKISNICETNGWSFVGFDGDFIGVEGKAVLRCHTHGDFSRRIADVLSNKHKCPSCSIEDIREKNRYSLDKCISIWKESCKKSGFKFIGLDGKYVSADNTKAIIECEEHGRWVASYSNFVLSGCGCSECSRGGFSYFKTGYVYALSSGDSIKIGITNNHQDRIARLRRNTPFSFDVVEIIEVSSGRKARKIERYLHLKYERSGFTGFDGATEWLKFNPNILEYLRSI